MNKDLGAFFLSYESVRLYPVFLVTVPVFCVPVPQPEPKTEQNFSMNPHPLPITPSYAFELQSQAMQSALLCPCPCKPPPSERAAAASRVFSTAVFRSHSVCAAISLDSFLVKRPNSYICVRPCDTGTRLVLPVAANLLLS